MFSLEKRRLRAALMAVCSFLTRGGGGGAGADLFSLATNARTRGNGREMCQGRVRLDIRKRFFPQRAVEPWNRLPREASRHQPGDIPSTWTSPSEIWCEFGVVLCRDRSWT